MWTVFADGPNGQRRCDLVVYGDTLQEALGGLPGGWHWWRVYDEGGNLVTWR